MASARYPARYFDGTSARPHLGVVEVDGHLLRFHAEGGPTIERAVEDIVRLDEIAGSEVHIELRESDGSSSKLVSDDPAFLIEVERAVEIFAPTPSSTAAAWSRRMPLWSWVVAAVLAVPLMYRVYVGLAERAHVLVSLEVEGKIGDAVAGAFQGDIPTSDDDELFHLATEMLTELKDPASPYPITLTVLDQDTPNAVAVPGGRIFLFTGIVAKCPTPDALAADWSGQPEPDVFRLKEARRAFRIFWRLTLASMQGCCHQ